MALNFNKDQDYILEDDVILIRPLQKDDYINLLPISLNEPETWDLSSKSAAGEEALKAYIAEALAQRAEGKEYPFIVFDKTTSRYAGSTRFYDIQINNDTLQLGYTWYGKDFRGTGLNKHCKFLLLQLAFETFSAERVEFRADNRNKPSIAAMKSIGCTVEGVIRSYMPLRNGGRRDAIILSILKDEWHGSVKESLKSKLR
ncbi:GNAT family protein [Mucilaginibacter panaciglaebae]|uniref:GNAT family protein n=1 Tax=Mucilaginibacter panaciglaebae TaxID=502331 RepID=A0ABP7WEA8_9SPHI